MIVGVVDGCGFDDWLACGIDQLGRDEYCLGVMFTGVRGSSET